MVLTLTSAETKLSEDKFMQLVGRNLPMIYVNHVESFESKLSGNLKAWEIWCGMYEEECKFRNPFKPIYLHNWCLWQWQVFIDKRYTLPCPDE